MAPGSNILLVESLPGELDQAAEYAASQPGVSVVSMSFGIDGEGSSATDLQTDPDFRTPAGHAPVTFIAASGDHGLESYPATSPNVLAIGGTELQLGPTNAIAQETVWNSTDASGNTLSSGGGLSKFEPRPPYQAGIAALLPGTSRGTPDVAYNAYSTRIYDSQVSSNPIYQWTDVEGTSAAAPQWAALVAIIDQGRAINGLAPLDGPTQTIPQLYALPASDFNDIIRGANQVGLAAGPGYDLVTGRGSPNVPKIVADMTTVQVPNSVGQAYQIHGRPVASTGIPASYTFLMQDRIIVVNTAGQVWAHDVGSTVSAPYEIPGAGGARRRARQVRLPHGQSDHRRQHQRRGLGPGRHRLGRPTLSDPRRRVALDGVPAKYVFPMGNRIIVVNTNGEVWAQDVGSTVGQPYQLPGARWRSTACPPSTSSPWAIGSSSSTPTARSGPRTSARRSASPISSPAPVALDGVPAKYVFPMDNRIIVVNTNGEVWANQVT